MTFKVHGVNYELDSDGTTVTITKEGESSPMYTDTVNQSVSPTEAMTEVLAKANTFLTAQFPGFVAEFMALFAKIVVMVTAGVPVLSIAE